MPGSRLTQHDRQRIASGLADGLSYTEIARALDRPASTVSREVTRNGGPDHYLAQRAHQATRRRARRRKSTSSPGEPATAGYGRDPEAVRDYVDRFTALIIETGLPPMPGRVLVCLLTSDHDALTAAELSRQLEVSPASISKAVGYLERLGLLRRERDPGHRRERYVVGDDDVWHRTWTASIQAIAALVDITRQGAEILGAATPAGGKLDRGAQFHELIHRDMTRAAERWLPAFTARRSPR